MAGAASTARATPLIGRSMLLFASQTCVLLTRKKLARASSQWEKKASNFYKGDKIEGIRLADRQ